MRMLLLCLVVTLPPTCVVADRPFARSVTEVPRETIEAIRRGIDRHVDAHLSRLNLAPRPPVDDATFLRRVHLAIVGRIPTLDESREFLDSKDADKRAVLIDRLLDSRGYVSHHFNFWADLLRVVSRHPNGGTGQPYIDFVKDSLARNKPYDQFVYEMLAAEGAALARGNGATGYYIRDRGMPEDNMANTARVFLGTRLECAQCHDHPFAPWTQQDFYELVAFTAGLTTRTKLNQSDGLSRVSAPEDRQLVNNVKKLLGEMSYGVHGGGDGTVRLPGNVQSGRDSSQEFVTAKTLFGKRDLVNQFPTSSSERRDLRSGPRFAFARWVTSPENPRFTKVIANRLWGKAMGRGVIDPVDDFTDDNPASNPELLEFLSQSMVDLDYDIKQFLRAVYNSKTYQRATTDEVTLATDGYHFQGPLLRRMSAEQLWDSLVTLAVMAPDQRGNPTEAARRGIFGEDLYDGYEQVRDLSLEQLFEFARNELAIQNELRDPERARKRSLAMQKPGERTAKELNELQRRVAKLKLKASLNPRDPARSNWLKEIHELTRRLNHIPAQISPSLVRASELSSPAPASHFLRQFGQSDREQVDNAHTDPAVNQVLTLMNGQIESQILSNPQTALMYQTATASDPLEVVYLCMLSRRPTPQERSIWLDLGDQVGKEAIEDLVWTLANTTEFLFIH
ncbi:DUF1549 domain-containing protein [Rhodopirellula sp. JC639]|uniref:DUF1549 domain-containing protein n=1 Tax=Stieleria mannarensis TaxID=2755585 RepID=UPI0015FFA2DB|nr:DUF1549 domain-containing protein [Rhodopirellula sp. JC639]